MKKSNNKSVIIFIFLTICMSLFLISFTILEGDYHWHIKAGEYMFKHGPLKHDIFSWYLSGKYWMSHEWLFEIILYVFKLVFGKYHLFIYGFICITSLLLILFFANKKNYLKNIPFSICWLIFAIIFSTFIQGRPHLISFNLLALTIWFLYDNYLNENSKLIYFLPIITIIWANVHGGSSNLSYLFCFVFLFAGLFNFKIGKVEMKRISKKQIFKYLIIALLCMISININIHGFKMFLYPYQNMTDKLMLENIMEWKPTDINNPNHWLYLIIVIVSISVGLYSKKKINFLDLVLFGVALLLGFKSIRFWVYTYIIMSFVIFNYVDELKTNKQIHYIALSISIILLSLAVFNTNRLTQKFNATYLNSDIIEKVKEENPQRLFNIYDHGGELIYNDIPVFIDSRADLYSKYNYADYLNISTLKGDYVALINKYNFDYFLVDVRFPINTYLRYDSNYEALLQSGPVILYKKNS